VAPQSCFVSLRSLVGGSFSINTLLTFSLSFFYSFSHSMSTLLSFRKKSFKESIRVLPPRNSMSKCLFLLQINNIATGSLPAMRPVRPLFVVVILLHSHHIYILHLFFVDLPLKRRHPLPRSIPIAPSWQPAFPSPTCTK
jgi:hypothetical protein